MRENGVLCKKKQELGGNDEGGWAGVRGTNDT